MVTDITASVRNQAAMPCLSLYINSVDHFLLTALLSLRVARLSHENVAGGFRWTTVPITSVSKPFLALSHYSQRSSAKRLRVRIKR